MVCFSQIINKLEFDLSASTSSTENQQPDTHTFLPSHTRVNKESTSLKISNVKLTKFC